MFPHEMQNCAELLLDLLCYEVLRERLSPEMEAMLADHLAECEYCRMKFLDFRRIVEKRITAYIQ